MRAIALSFVVCLAVGGGQALAVDQPVSAKQLKLKASASKGKLVLLSKDTSLQQPANGSADDPQSVGATLTLCAANGQVADLAMAAAGWSSNKPGTVLKWKQKGQPTGVKVALLKGGRTLKVVGRDSGLDLTGDLGAVGVRLTMGSLRQCALFAANTVKKDEAGRFEAADASASALTDCSDAALGCSGSPAGAFVR